MKTPLQTLLVVAALALAACADPKAPAAAALKAAEDALATVKVEATRYVPDQTQAIESALVSARETFAKGDYPAVVATTTELPAKVTALTSAIAARKTALTTAWATLESVTAAIESARARIDAITKSGKLPKGVTQAAVDDASAKLEDAARIWSDARAAFSAGDLVDAVSAGERARDAVEQSVAGLSAPAVAK
jgi:hypothetical protein